MKLRTTIGALLDAFALTTPTLDRKGAGANLYLNANETSKHLYLYSTNMIAETATKIKVEEMESGGEVLVNPSKLRDGLSGLDKTSPVSLELTPTGNMLKVQSGKVKLSLAASSDVKELSSRLRTIPFKSEPVVSVPITELTEFTKRSVFCIPNDETGQRAALAALKLSDSDTCEEAFATDGSIAVHIISSKKQSKGVGLGQGGLLIPAVALHPLAGITSKRKKGETVSVILGANRNKVFFKFADGTHFGTTTMATQYPNLRPVMDQPTQYRFTIGRERLNQALSRASAYVSSADTKKTIELEIGTEWLSIRANGDDSLSDQLDISFDGGKPTEAIRLGMNINHLLNIASGSRSENLTFGFTSTNKPLVITDSEGTDDEKIDVKYVVMGVRIA